MHLNLSLLVETGQINNKEEQNLGFVEKGKYYNLFGTDVLLENYDLDSLGEVSELSVFSETPTSTKLTENGSKEEQINSIYFSDLMARTRKTVRLEEGPRTSGAGGWDRTEVRGMESQAKLQMKV